MDPHSDRTHLSDVRAGGIWASGQLDVLRLSAMMCMEVVYVILHTRWVLPPVGVPSLGIGLSST